MPQYQYKCNGSHFVVLTHSINECDSPHYCPQCGGIMHRVPQNFAVNWNGLPPHLEGARSPVVQNFLDTADERRENYLANKETK